MREELMKGLTEEQKKKVSECKSAEEVLALAKEEGITLTDEQLEAVSGGCDGGRKFNTQFTCPRCNSHEIDYQYYLDMDPDRDYTDCKCKKCGYEWREKAR